VITLNNDRQHTNQGHRPEVDIPRLQIVRAIVARGTTRPNPDDVAHPVPVKVAIVHLWDGINQGVDDIPVSTSQVRKPGDVIFIFRPSGGTGQTNPETASPPEDESTEYPVIWKEIFVEDKKYTIQITGNAVITGQTNKWEYAWTFVRPQRKNSWAAPTDTTEQDTDIISGVKAYNTCEANNSGAGWQGNSVNIDLLPPDINILPVQGNPVVRAWVETNCDGNPELYFSYENAITIDCPGP
jgi:hypothetical protein